MRVALLLVSLLGWGCATQHPQPADTTVEPSESTPAEVVPTPRAGTFDKGPLSGDFEALTVQAEPGSSVPLSLTVRAREALDAGAVRLTLPPGVELTDGALSATVQAWALGQERSFAWTVRVGDVADAVVMAEVTAGPHGRAFAVTVNPSPPGGELRRDAKGRVLRVQTVGD